MDDRDGHRDQTRLAGGEGARAAIRGEPVLADDLEDALARSWRDVASLVHHARYRRDRDAGQLRDVANRGPARGLLPRRRHARSPGLAPAPTPVMSSGGHVLGRTARLQAIT